MLRSYFVRRDIMPYVNTIFSSRLTEEKRDILKARIGKAIEIFPGKSEEWLFVEVQDERELYFKGIKSEKAAIIEVKLFGKQTREVKDEFTAAICELLEKELSIPGENVYVIFEEVEEDNWGWNGGLF